MAVAIGAASGSLAWGIAAAAGIAAFVTRVSAAFDILRWAGRSIRASSVRKALTRGTATIWMERILGVVLLGFAARIAIG